MASLGLAGGIAGNDKGCTGGKGGIGEIGGTGSDDGEAIFESATMMNARVRDPDVRVGLKAPRPRAAVVETGGV